MVSDRGKNLRFFFDYGPLDHFTLEENFKSWHATILTSSDKPKTKLPSYGTMQIKKGLTFWFELTIQDPTVLEKTPEEHRILLHCPPKDSDRRINLLMDARDGSIFHLVHLPEGVLIRNNEFVHFDFFIGPSSIDTKNLPCSVPTLEPMVKNFSQMEKGTPFRKHPVMLLGIEQKNLGHCIKIPRKNQ